MAIYKLDLREHKNDGRRPVVLYDGRDSLLYWRKDSKQTELYHWLRAGWYDRTRYQPETVEQSQLFVEGFRLRGNWRKSAVESKLDEIPESYQKETFFVLGESFRRANFPNGENDVRAAVEAWLANGESLLTVCKRYGLTPKGRVLQKAADVLGYARPKHGLAALEAVEPGNGD